MFEITGVMRPATPGPKRRFRAPLITPHRSDRPAVRKLPIAPDSLLYEAEAAHVLRISVSQLIALRLCGNGPIYQIDRRSPRTIRYRLEDVLVWAHSRRRSSCARPQERRTS